MNKLFAGDKDSEGSDDNDKGANFSTKLSKKEQKIDKKKKSKDKITLNPRVLTSGVTAASRMPEVRGNSKAIKKAGAKLVSNKMSKTAMNDRAKSRRMAIPRARFNR